MTPDERHARLKQIEAETRKALDLRAKYQEEVDMLYSEREQLQDECFDEFCPCVEQEGSP
jgi:hypothetical protein